MVITDRIEFESECQKIDEYHKRMAKSNEYHKSNDLFIILLPLSNIK
jgi:hypothetical protein